MQVGGLTGQRGRVDVVPPGQCPLGQPRAVVVGAAARPGHVDLGADVVADHDVLARHRPRAVLAGPDVVVTRGDLHGERGGRDLPGAGRRGDRAQLQGEGDRAAGDRLAHRRRHRDVAVGADALGLGQHRAAVPLLLTGGGLSLPGLARGVGGVDRRLCCVRGGFGGHLRGLGSSLGRGVGTGAQQPDRDDDQPQHEQGEQQASTPVDASGQRSAGQRGHAPNLGTAGARTVVPRPYVRDLPTIVGDGRRPPRTAAPVVRRSRARPAVALALGDPVVGHGLGVHAAADPGVAGPARARPVARPVAPSGRPGHRAGGRGGPDVGATRVSAPGTAAARRRARDRGAPRRRGPRRPRRPARAAGRGRLHRLGGRRLRARAAPPRPRHQRPAGARPGPRRGRAPARGGHPCRTGPRHCAAPGRRRRRRDLVGGGDGARRPGLHVPTTALRRLPGRRHLRVARGRPPGVRRAAPEGAGLGRHRPPVPRPPARGGPGHRGDGLAATPRRGVG